MLCTVLIIIICAVSGIIYFNNPVSKFKSEIINNKQTEAVKLYHNKIKGDSDKEEKVISFLKDKIVEIEKSFVDEKIDYDKAKSRLETIKNIRLVPTDVTNSIIKINNLNDSRIAFKKAEEFFKNNDLKNAIEEYKNVISDDNNYEKAKEQIKNNEKKYKDQILKSAEEFANKKDYDKAITTLSEAISIFSDDADLTAKNETYKKLQQEKLEAERKQKIEELKGVQELVVVSTSVVSGYFNIDDEAQVIVKNNTNKVVKNFTVGILMYDGNGYPLRSGILAGENQLFKGKAESVNIQAGETFGYNSSWNLYTDYGTIKEIIACVKDVEYYDGSKWTNDYYNYWQDEHLGKPYK
ncbi:DUF5780 domain-containing protein [Clostridium argentinense]|nr:DUF5780 domain-containing protein [Clostridium argentinense]ARC86062.1 hypothetical protein RSJ17_16970 [Clostridium argentinense]NFF39002.1 zinc ribbon domain-containing protein [Clostridium argentinense]NFP48794.1 zinc ribbon domain-containing protein [Clostridium argentinense]NFP70938.1 zinc ribbon domain-containing protein [Clostridium argentinense]NFP76046.1 zinc ribbon domain-containing protein [Clostridium argentinense]